MDFITRNQYITKVKIAASLCEGVNVDTSEYLRGISEFLADSEELDVENYGEALDARSQGVRNDIEEFIVDKRRNAELKLSDPVKLAVEQIRHVKEMLGWMLAHADACETENGVIGSLLGLDGGVVALEAAMKNINYFQRTR